MLNAKHNLQINTLKSNSEINILFRSDSRSPAGRRRKDSKDRHRGKSSSPVSKDKDGKSAVKAKDKKEKVKAKAKESENETHKDESAADADKKGKKGKGAKKKIVKKVKEKKRKGKGKLKLKGNYPFPITKQGWHKKNQVKNPSWVLLGFLTQKTGFVLNVPFVDNVNSILTHKEYYFQTNNRNYKNILF